MTALCQESCIVARAPDKSLKWIGTRPWSLLQLLNSCNSCTSLVLEFLSARVLEFWFRRGRRYPGTSDTSRLSGHRSPHGITWSDISDICRHQPTDVEIASWLGNPNPPEYRRWRVGSLGEWFSTDSPPPPVPGRPLSSSGLSGRAKGFRRPSSSLRQETVPAFAVPPSTGCLSGAAKSYSPLSP
jgi:hypothetical protein